ncbi:ABC transporter permease [Streptococcus sp. DD13]|uniref:ABC transporter permease n=1 Tax=Streptococcus sp. DD13 TaxID=1777881 RepID=UPI000795B43B|nr:ABC transporter permease [Streptococcus sp. DD13]KXT78690.1 putative deoxyribose-specific ABC transporter, permease protein [Streptococcus sp. DD13]
MSKRLQDFLVPLIAVILGLVAGAIVMLVFGYDPLAAYDEMIYTAFSTPYNIGEIFRTMAPLMLIALGFAISSKAGFFNVGLPGQAMIAWTSAATFTLMNPDLPKFISIPATMIIAMIAGGLAGAIPGILRAYLGTSEVIITIMLNYIILHVSNAVVLNFLVPNFTEKGTGTTVNLPKEASYQVDWLKEMFGSSRINLGIFMAIIAVIIIWFVLKKTTLGYEITAVGLNPNAAEYAGMSAKRIIILSMLISGALAGLGGAVDGLGTYVTVKTQASSLSIGWNGMAVALLAANSPIGIPFAAFLYGVLEAGRAGMQAVVVSEMVDVVSAFIIFFVGISYVIRKGLIDVPKLFDRFKKKENVKGEQA